MIKSGKYIILFICISSATVCSQKNPNIEKLSNLEFYRDVDFARRKARKENRPLFIDFYADWCVNCKLWNKLAVEDKDLNAALQKAILVKVYDTDKIFQRFKNNPEYEELNVGLPFFLILNPDGSTRWKTINYRDKAGMIRALTE